MSEYVKPLLSQMINKVEHQFMEVKGGIRTQKSTHPEFGPALTGAITEKPHDVTTWLVLADRLQDEGNEAHHMIRLIFVPDYVPPEGFEGHINRESRYWESGATYFEGMSISYETVDGVRRFKQHIRGSLSQGNMTQFVTREEVIKLITKQKGRYVPQFASLRVTGSVPPVVAFIPPGSKIWIRKDVGDQVDWAEHTTKEEIIVPLDTPEHEPFSRWVWMKYMGYQLHIPVYSIRGR